MKNHHPSNCSTINQNNGNILFLILIAVALFAALSYAVTSTSRTGGGAIESEKAKLSEGELNFYLAEIEQGKNRLMLINSCGSIDYTIPENQPSTGNKRCHLFHPDGGGVIYRDFGLSFCDGVAQQLSPGDMCGSVIYAGNINGGALFTTISDLGIYTWNASTTNWTVTGFTSNTDGFSNTDGLVNLVDAGAPYNAANACRGLGAEWYLPARDELNLLWENRIAIGNFTLSSDFPAGGYWSSSESDNIHARYQRFGNGLQSQTGKHGNLRVRCVRRD